MITPDGERTLYCQWCGKPLEGITDNRQRFHGDCYTEYRRGMELKKGGKTLYTYTCPICGKVFTSDKKGRTYDKMECYYTSIRGAKFKRTRIE